MNSVIKTDQTSSISSCGNADVKADKRTPQKKKRQLNRLLSTNNFHIGIIGSGLAGLSAAIAILRAANDNNGRDRDKSYDENLKNGKVGSSNDNSCPDSGGVHGTITIYERDLHVSDRKEGYGMTLTYDPKGPLAKLGVLEEVAKRDCPSRCHYLFNEKGEVKGYFGNEFYDTTASGGQNVNRGAGQRGNLRIPRSELRSILMNSLLEAEGAKHSKVKVRIVWGKRLLSYVDRPASQKLSSLHCNTNRINDVQHDSEQRPVLLNFDDGTTDLVDLVIGADGVHSIVAKQYLSTTLPHPKKTNKSNNGSTDNFITHSNNEDEPDSGKNERSGGELNNNQNVTSLSTTISSPPSAEPTNASNFPIAPRYLGIFIILGISDAFHPLIDERGFYTLDGTHRLFIMPFQGSRMDDITATFAKDAQEINSNEVDGVITNEHGNQHQFPQRKRKTMWQLSFPVDDQMEARRLSKLPPDQLRHEVLKRCESWNAPFPRMVKETPLETIWGTGLLDRDPQIFLDHQQSLEIHGRLPSHVVLVGDAAHAMSPFKGQGANQALADGPLLAKWLTSAKMDSAVRGFMREMARRSGVKVRASREAAEILHSEKCWEWLANDGISVFHGVQRQHVHYLLDILKARAIGAALGSNLDPTINSVIQELNIADKLEASNSSENDIPPSEMKKLQTQALHFASTADLHRLRELSRSSFSIIPTAVDSVQRTCLHLAARSGDVDICRWLLSEIKMPCHLLDSQKQSPLDLAEEYGHKEVKALLTSWINRVENSCEESASSNSTTVATSNPQTNHTCCLDSHAPLPNSNADTYRLVEQQLRGLRTTQQLSSKLRQNRMECKHSSRSCTGSKNQMSDDRDEPSIITHVVGCPLEKSDTEVDDQALKNLARHGAILLRNFVPREIDQLALVALALRPLKLDYPDSDILSSLRTTTKSQGRTVDGSPGTMSEKSMKKQRRGIEELKSKMPISDNSIIQTNFGPEEISKRLTSSQHAPIIQQSLPQSTSTSKTTRKRRMNTCNTYPLSKLRYLNLGEWNYNWGDRKYEKVPNTEALSPSLVSLANRAYRVALQLIHQETKCCEENVDSFDPNMAICNFYHLQRPSDRLGGHRDNIESNLSLPLVTVSLGAPGIFLLGGQTRGDKPTAILLRAGDCMVLSGKARQYYHGIPSILEYDDYESTSQNVNVISCNVYPGDVSSNYVVFPELKWSVSGQVVDTVQESKEDAKFEIPTVKEILFAKAFLATVRMNMSIRQV